MQNFNEYLARIQNNDPSITTVRTQDFVLNKQITIKKSEPYQKVDEVHETIDLEATKQRISDVAKALKTNKHVTYLDASHCIKATPLLECLKENHSITHLKFYGSTIGQGVMSINPGTKKVKLLCEALEFGRIKSLDISWSGIHDMHARYLFNHLKNNKTLEYLNLDHNWIDKSVGDIVGYLKTNKTLKTLSLNKNMIKDANIISTIFPENHTLTQLDLFNNPFDNKDILIKLEQEHHIVHLTGESTCSIS